MWHTNVHSVPDEISDAEKNIKKFFNINIVILLSYKKNVTAILMPSGTLCREKEKRTDATAPW